MSTNSRGSNRGQNYAEQPVQPRSGSRIPPQNLDAEISTLGSLLLDPESVMKVVDVVKSEDFYRPEHATIYAAMSILFEKRIPIDLVTVSDELASLKKLEEVGGPAKLSSLVSSVSTAANVAHYANIVREKAMLRRLITAAGEIGEIGFQEERSTSDILDTAERTLFAVTQRFLKQNFTSVRSILDDSFERLGLLAQQDGALRGTPTGFRSLDRILGGLQKSDLLILAARPSMGKCVTGNTRVLASDGSLTTIQSMVETQKGSVATLSSDWQFSPAMPTNYIDNGIKQTFLVRTALGREIEATATHPLLTIQGWRSIANLSVSDRIAVPKKIAFFGTEHIAEHLVKSLAYYLSDGSVTGTQPRFTNVNPIIVRDFLRAMYAFGGVQITHTTSGGTRASSFAVSVNKNAITRIKQEWSVKFAEYREMHRAVIRQTVLQLGLSPANMTAWQNGVALPSYMTAQAIREHSAEFPLPELFSDRNPVRTYLEQAGIWGKTAAEKQVPSEVFTLVKEDIALFLNRLFSCDGTACVSRCGENSVPVISYATVSKQLAQDVQHLLLRFGILAKLRSKQVLYKGSRRPSYEVEIHAREDILTFAREIGILGKESALDKVVRCAQSKKVGGWTKDTIPVEIWHRVLTLKGEKSWSEVYRDLCLPVGTNFHVQKHAPRRELVMKLAQYFGDTELVQLAQADVYWDRIVSIESTGLNQVYDLTVPETHNFLANDIIVHNTAFAMNIAEHVAVNEKKVVGVFSLEMSKEQLVDRLISSIGRVDAWKLRNGNLSEDDMSRLIEAQAQLAEANLFIDDSPMASVMEVRAKARRLQSEYGLQLIVIDYLQLMQGSARNQDNRVQEVSEISRSLKALAKELECPVIALSQLSRAVEARNDKRPMLSDLRESGSIEQDADVVMFLYRDDYYNKNKEEHDNLLEVIVSKHRNGPTGDAKLSAQLQYSRFYDIDLRQ